MYRADKFYGPDRQVLSNISLSFLPRREDRRPRAERRRQVDAAQDHGRARGAVVGRRRARPEGERRLSRRRSRSSIPRRTCARTSRTASASCASCSTASTRSPPRSPSPTPTSTRCSPSRRRCRTRIDRADAWSLDQQLDRAMDALRLPDGDRDVDDALGRRASPRRALPAAALRARPAAPRRADEPPRRRVGRLARALPRRATRARSMAVTHDRYFLDNVAGWILELDRGKGIPFQGNYSSWLEQKEARLGVEEKTERRAPPHAPARARVGAHEPDRAPREVEGAPRARTRSCSPRSRRRSSTRSRSTSRPARGSATSSSGPSTCRRASATGCSSRT